MRFKPGQKVVCVEGDPWISNEADYGPKFGPQFNDIVTVHGYPPQHPGYVILSEYRYSHVSGREMAFSEHYFEPLIEDAILEEELNQCRQPNETKIVAPAYYPGRH